MKRTKLRKRSKSPLAKVQDQLWQLCRNLTFYLYQNDDGSLSCYTCTALYLQGRNLHCGHVPWPKSVLPSLMKYDIRLLRPQCSTCNIWKGGMGAVAYRKMAEEVGEEAIEKLEKERRTIQRADIGMWKKRLADYQELWDRCA